MQETYLVQNGTKKSSSFVAVLIGLALFVGSFVIIYKNEGRINLSRFAERAIPVENGGSYKDGELVSITGTITTDEIIGDGLFKKPEKYVALKRTVEMYAWDEQRETTDNGTRYIYKTEWTQFPDDSSLFGMPQGHYNPNMPFRSEVFTPKMLLINEVSLNGKELAIPSPRENVNLTKANTQPVPGYLETKIIGEGSHLYMHAVKPTEDTTSPQVGDIRISYQAIPVDSLVTVYGAYQKTNNGQSVAPYTAMQTLKSATEFYHLRFGTKDESTGALGKEFTTSLWLLRGLGFLLMLIGLNMILSPIKTLLGYIPIVGPIGSLALGLIVFVTVVILYGATLLISIVAHSIIGIIIAGVLILAVAWFIARKIANKKQEISLSKPIQPPAQQAADSTNV